jgi:hypothetical protein
LSGAAVQFHFDLHALFRSFADSTSFCTDLYTSEEIIARLY